MATIDIKLKKVNKIYHEGEKLCGLVIVEGRGEVMHSGINLVVNGTVDMQLSAKSVGLFEAFYNSVKPIIILNSQLEVAKPGKLPSGCTEIPFEVLLKPSKNRTMFETYHGVFIKIQYTVACEMKRSLLNKDLRKSLEFIIEYKAGTFAKEDVKEVTFEISPNAIVRSKKAMSIPNCLITGRLSSSVCNIAKPFCGEVTVKHCDKQIKSIELQLVRVETCGCAEGYAKDATEIQNLQIADGDVCRGMAIPVYMILPRLFTCPTIETPNFKIEFEVNIVVVFNDEHLITENFPIKIIR